MGRIGGCDWTPCETGIDAGGAAGTNRLVPAGFPLLVGKGFFFFFLGLTSADVPATRAEDAIDAGGGEVELAIIDVVIVLVDFFFFTFF